MDFSDLECDDKKEKIKNFEEMSIEALLEYIQELQSEIFEVEKIIAEKKRALEGANSFFKD